MGYDNITEFDRKSVATINDYFRRVNDDITAIRPKDRGDPSAVDYAVGALTTDGAWHDLDLSSKLPVGTKTVLLRIEVKDDAAGSEVSFRLNGNVNIINSAKIATQVANIPVYADVMVFCDSYRKIEYMATNTTFTTINITIAGWWK